MRYQGDYYDTGPWGYQQLSNLDPRRENDQCYKGVDT